MQTSGSVQQVVLWHRKGVIAESREAPEPVPVPRPSSAAKLLTHFGSASTRTVILSRLHALQSIIESLTFDFLAVHDHSWGHS